VLSRSIKSSNTLASNTSDSEQTEADQVKMVTKLLGSFILHIVGGDLFYSLLLHFLTILSIDEKKLGFCKALDFSPILAGVAYYCRVIRAEVLFPSDRATWEEQA
jgi:hypothetical protein